ncbi:MAG TPA: hypothetical protein VGN64_04040 [Dyadobacter sp.]|jgi:hypothetical protein|nr:hypothetical protein [Dyadobacter sp.]
MTELPDDELDKLFRMSSEEFESNYEPEDWNTLRRRLDRHDGKTTLSWLKKWWPLALLGLMIPAGLSYYLFKNSSNDAAYVTRQFKTEAQNPVVDKPVTTANPADQAGSTLTNKDSGVSYKTDINSDKITSVADKAVNPKHTVPNTTKKTILSASLKYSKSPEPYASRQNDFDKSGVRSVGSPEKAALQQTKDIADSSVNKANTDQSGTRDITKNQAAGKENQIETDQQATADKDANWVINPLNSLPLSLNEPLILPKVTPAKQQPMPEAEKTRDLSPKLAFRFGYSPDMTTVGLKNFTKPGSAVSLKLEYSILRKLYIQTGVVRSVKDYRARGGEYALSPYVTNINTPYSVDGMCTMIEIPLGLRYDLTQTEKSRWFAGAGMSSYYVQKEKYTYQYEQYVHGQYTGWQGKTGWFLLSHLNASAGYERRISNQLSIMAEPYIQLPLKGVGYGKVNLITTGMWLSVRYTPVFNR